MSNSNASRRVAAEVSFAGVDITKSIRPYLISLTYTDNEEDETDDLQIKLQDRGGIWLESWLGAMIDAAASVTTQTLTDQGGTYTVTAEIGLNIRSGPGTGYGKYGALSYGATVEVESISNGWAQIQYNGKTAYVSAQYLSATQSGQSMTTAKLNMEAAIVRENWSGDGKDSVLHCGSFELDSVSASGPPTGITIKGTSLPFSEAIRQTEKSKAWEAYYLSGIAREMAANAGMTLMYEAATDPYYPRVEQAKTSDISFLSTLCHNAGISLKATGGLLVLFDQAKYESKPSVLKITQGDKSYISYDFGTGSAQTKYATCRVSYVDQTGRCIEATVSDPEQENSSTKQQLEITAKVSNVAEAEALAEKMLRLRNKFEKSASFTVPGNPELVAGVTVELEKWGTWSGKYIVKQAKHTVGSSGYTTKLALRPCLEGV